MPSISDSGSSNRHSINNNNVIIIIIIIIIIAYLQFTFHLMLFCSTM
jgi:hypothetical protein